MLRRCPYLLLTGVTGKEKKKVGEARVFRNSWLFRKCIWPARNSPFRTVHGGEAAT